jgi:hypothetical protein
MLPGNDLKQRVEFFADWDYNIKVAGVKFSQEKLSKLYEEDWNKINISLSPEPDNPYDSNAIKILADDQGIGYLPRMVAQAFKDNHIDVKKYKCALIYITAGDRGKIRTAKIALKEE